MPEFDYIEQTSGCLPIHAYIQVGKNEGSHWLPNKSLPN